MLLKNYQTFFKNELENLYEKEEVNRFFLMILEHLHQMQRVDLVIHPNYEISSEKLDNWNRILEDLKTEKPIQYILGESWFYGLKFEVNENTLIPRPETEELVEWIIAEEKHKITDASFHILDIGTGSGCIPIALKKNLPMSNISAIDISEKALQTANRNALANEVSVSFSQKDILKTEGLPEKYNVIVSNPPYVRELEKAEISKNVLAYEPHLALFVADNDALLFYRKIAELAKKHLTSDGVLYFEINQYLANETLQLLNNLGFKNIVLRKDFKENDRMIKAEL